MAKTILIGLDGATFTVLEPMMAGGVMPFLRDFVATGVRASLRSVIPALTPPAWTSLMTGKRPGEHGIFDFFQKDAPDSRFFRFAAADDIHSATIWTLASEWGHRVTALNFPLMFPPPAVNGCVVPGGWMPWRQLRLGCHPPGLFDRLKDLPTFSPRELSHDMALEEKALEGCAREEYADWIKLHMRRELRWSEVFLHLMREEPADLSAVLFDGVDKLQHLCWRFLDPAFRVAAPTPWEEEIRGLCEDYFRQLDGIIAKIVARAGPEAIVIMASDHGFGPTSDIFYLNTWLEQQGYLAWATDGGTEPEGSHHVGISQIARHVFELDWTRTVAYAATPSSQGIHIVRQKPGTDVGLSPEAYRVVRSELVEALRRLRHPLTGRPVVAEIHAREEVFAGLYESLAPDLTLILANDGVVSILKSDTAVRRRPEPVGTHRPEGIFLGRGPGLRSGDSLGEISILDVAPLLLHCLDVPVPEDVSGHLPREAFEPAELRQRPPSVVPVRRFEPGAASKGLDPSVTNLDAAEEALVLRRLSALGYLE